MSNYICGCEYQFLIFANIFILFVCFPASTGEYCIFGNLCIVVFMDMYLYLWICICIGETTVSAMYVFGLLGTSVVIIVIYMHVLY